MRLDFMSDKIPAIDQTFEVLEKMVDVIQGYNARNEKEELKLALTGKRVEFDRLYSSCEKDNNQNDGIKAFQLIQQYVERVKGQYDRNPVDNARVKSETLHARQVANFFLDVCRDICGMLQNTPQTDTAYSTMIQEQLATYTPITFDYVEGMQRRREATHRQLKAAGKLGALLAKLKAVL